MNWKEKDIQELDRLFHNLVRIQSDTGTALENEISNYIYAELSSWPYYERHTHYLEKRQIENDPFGRSNVWALVRRGPETVILMNHHDAVDIEEYGAMKSGIALQMMMLKKTIEEIQSSDDLAVGGRSLLFLSVSDEENLSAGMRDGVKLLKDLEDKMELKYVTAINSEPYMKENEAAPVYYEGSVGKTMAMILARGKKAHVGNVFEGLNPTFLISKMQMDIELSPYFSDQVDGEISPPPTFVYTRDQKKMYDASIPELAAAYFSLLTLNQTPSEILAKLVDIGQNAFEYCVEQHKVSYGEDYILFT